MNIYETEFQKQIKEKVKHTELLLKETDEELKKIQMFLLREDLLKKRYNYLQSMLEMLKREGER